MARYLTLRLYFHSPYHTLTRKINLPVAELYFTGSVYNDVSLRHEGLIGEGVVSGAVIVVKIHDFRLLAESKVCIL